MGRGQAKQGGGRGLPVSHLPLKQAPNLQQLQNQSTAGGEHNVGGGQGPRRVEVVQGIVSTSERVREQQQTTTTFTSAGNQNIN